MTRLALLLAAALAFSGAAEAQKFKTYPAVVVSIPKGPNDMSLSVFRSKLFELARKKDKDALGKMIVRDFFWERDFGGGFDRKLSAFSNFERALNLNAETGAGWRYLAAFAEQLPGPHASKRGVICAPPEPKYDAKAFEQLVKVTGTDVFDWSYPAREGLVVRAKAEQNAPVVATLGLHFLFTDLSARAPDFDPEKTWTPVVTRDGKRGFVAPGELLTPLDPRLCFVRRGGRWFIAGYQGGGD
jgi:hypothetical protein